MKFTCKTCNNEFQNKNDMMMHKKREHPNTVNMRKDLETDSCRKGPRSCWFHHDQPEILRTTTRNTRQSPIRAPLLSHVDFPKMPTSPRATAVGNMSLELQQLSMLTKNMQQQQQQMAIMMSEIIKLRI